MNAKMIAFDHEAREATRRGVRQLARAVKVTLGPRGRNVVIEKKFGSPVITKDGVTVAKEIELIDKYENMGAQMVREVASKTSDVAGDGTTTATVLAEAIYEDGLRMVAAGADPMTLKRGIDLAVKAVVEQLRVMSMEVTDSTAIAQVGAIAANNDDEIGKMIAQAMDKVGKDGVITIEEGKGMATEVELVEGMQFDRGYLSPYFVTDAESMECVLEDVYILIYEKKISSLKEILPILEKVAKAGRQLLIIAEDVDGKALATLVINKIRGTLKVCAVKAPGFGDRRKALLEDLATLTGGETIFADLGRDLDKTELEHLGRARKVVLSKDKCTVIEGAGTTEAIQERIQKIRSEVERATSDYDREKLNERLAKLAGGVAQINVGAATELEMKEKKARIEDALHATRAAVEEGIVAGGGVALIRAQSCLEALDADPVTNAAVQIVKKALERPLRQIAENAGMDGAVVVHMVRSSDDINYGYNARIGEYGDLLAWGVVDPTKVTRTALQNAASIATLLLTTDCVIAEKPKKSKKDGDSDEDFDDDYDY